MVNYILSINMAMTLDGKVTRPDGKWYGLTSNHDKRMMDIYRSQHEILIVGKNSILNDDPILHLRYVRGNDPIPVVLINKGTISKHKKIFESTQTPIIFCTVKNYEMLENELSGLANIINLGDKEISAQKVLERLISMGYTKILLEGGPSLNYSFLKADLVTRIYLTIVPFIIAKEGLKNFVTGEVELLNFETPKWKLTSYNKVENEIFLCYEKTET